MFSVYFTLCLDYSVFFFHVMIPIFLMDFHILWLKVWVTDKGKTIKSIQNKTIFKKKSINDK